MNFSARGRTFTPVFKHFQPSAKYDRNFRADPIFCQVSNALTPFLLFEKEKWFNMALQFSKNVTQTGHPC